MNKQPTPLEALDEYKYIKDFYQLKATKANQTLRIFKMEDNYYQIIENALKKQEKQEKVLRIIVEKKVDVGLFITLFIDNEEINGGYEEYAEAYKKGCNNAYYVTQESRKILIKEEFDLLKDYFAYAKLH